MAVPAFIVCVVNLAWIFPATQAAIVSTQSAGQVAFFLVQVVLQDSAAHAQVGSYTK